MDSCSEEMWDSGWEMIYRVQDVDQVVSCIWLCDFCRFALVLVVFIDVVVFDR